MAKKNYTISPGVVQLFELDTAITATNTPKALVVAGAKAIGLMLTAAGITTRTGVLVITVSLDGGTTYVTYNMLLDNTANTNGEELTRVASKSRGATGTDILWFSKETLGAITHLKAKITVNDSGTPAGNFTLTAVIEY